MSKEYDFLIVGAGFFGATFARMATDLGKKCLVIDKKNHIAGAAHDFAFKDYYVSSYGAHIFHTNNDEVWNFINKFTKFIPFINKPKVISENKVYSFPINLMTLHQLWGVKTPEEAQKKLELVTAPFKDKTPKNFEEWALSMVGEEIYKTFFYGYTKKQWFKEPKELPTSIIQRLPIRLTYEENYFATKYQGIPQNGYTKTIQNMLDQIDVEINIDYLKNKSKWDSKAKIIVYSGPVDSLYKFEFGSLEYNTLHFKHEQKFGDVQGTAVLNYTSENIPYIRSIEHKHFYNQNDHIKHYNISKLENEKLSYITYDYPVPYKENPEPFYPIRNTINSEIYSKYKALNNTQKNMILGGRIGEYKYLDMDQSIASAISKARKAIKNV